MIEATLVSSAPASSSADKPKPTPPKPEPQEAAPPPQPKPEPKPAEAVEPPQVQPQAPIPNPDVIEREKAALLALEQAEEQAKLEEQERRIQEQVELDELEREEVERRERLTEMQEEQAQQLADIRKKREEAEQRRKREEEKLKQLEDRRPVERSSPQPAVQDGPPADRLGNNGVDESLAGRYQLAIQQAVTQNWLRPDSAPSGIHCSLRIVQIPGGEVIQVSVTSPCNADDLTRRSIEAAVLKANPLPYRGYEGVFQRDIRFNFRYDG